MSRTLCEQLLVSMAIPPSATFIPESVNDLGGICTRAGVPDHMAEQVMAALRQMEGRGHITWTRDRTVLTADGLAVREAAMAKGNPKWCLPSW